MALTLIADDRERAVITWIGALTYEYKVCRIEVGDYVIHRSGSDGSQQIVACVERKTLPDFASSIIDGRYRTSTRKMINLRERTGCDLFYLIEGPAFPSVSRRFSRVAYSVIQSAMFSLMVRDKVFIIQTENVMHTAQRLNVLIRAYDKHEAGVHELVMGGVAETPVVLESLAGGVETAAAAAVIVGAAAAETDAVIVGAAAETDAVIVGAAAETDAVIGGAAAETDAVIGATAAETDAVIGGAAGGAANGESRGVLKILTEVNAAQKPPSIAEAATAMWTQIPWITINSAVALLNRGNVFQVMFEDIPIKQFILPTGAPLNKRAIRALTLAKRNVRDTFVRLISYAPGVSKTTAGMLVDEIAARARGGPGAGSLSIKQIFAPLAEPSVVAGVKIQQKKKEVRFGDKKARRVCDLLLFTRNVRDE